MTMNIGDNTIMRKVLSITIIVVALLLLFQGCGQLKLCNAEYNEISIKTDTLFIDFSTFELPQKTANLYINNVTRLNDSYYFNIDLYTKDTSNLYTIQTDSLGNIIAVIEMPELADDVYNPASYIDLFVDDGLIWMRMNYRSSANDPTFFLDTNEKRWVENKGRLDHVLFENEQYKVLYYECDGSCYSTEYIWFENKATGEEHYITARDIINYTNNKFYFTCFRNLYRIEEVESIDQLLLCDESTSYYDKDNKTKNIDNQNEEMQLHYKGEQMTNTIFEDTTSNPDLAYYNMYLNHGGKTGFHLYTSFVSNGNLLHICSIDDKHFVGEVRGGEMYIIRELNKIVYFPNNRFVKHRKGQNIPEFLFVKSDVKNSECLMEINNGIIYYHYIKPYIKNIY